MTAIKKGLSQFGTDYIRQAENSSVQGNWSKIKKNISTLMDKHIPTKKSTTRHNLPWFNHRLRRMNRKLQRLYNKQRKSQLKSDEEAFKAYRTT